MAVGAVLAFPCSAPADLAPPDCPGYVVVAIDLDAERSGLQNNITVAPGTELVRGVTIWIFDPMGTAPLHSIGYVGGLNRGVAFGHTPEPEQHAGTVVGVAATAVQPVVPGHTAFVSHDGIEKLFVGPELQYFEYGPTPGVISADPPAPVVTLDIELAGATEGDVFRFYLGDMTTAWIAQWSMDPGGAFSTQGLNTLDSGGDAIPDGTATAFGLDPDVPVPVPPALYLVDYVDSPPGGGGAIIRVAAPIPAVGGFGLAAIAVGIAAVGLFLFSRMQRHMT